MGQNDEHLSKCLTSLLTFMSNNNNNIYYLCELYDQLTATTAAQR